MFTMFNNDELYTLKRSLIESSGEFAFGDFPVIIKETHERLLNEVLDEVKRRKM